MSTGPQKPIPNPGPFPPPVPLKLDNIQGDILAGFPKKTETLYFFEITDKDKFRYDLRSFNPLVKSVAQVLADRKAIDEHKKKHPHHPGSKLPLIPLVGVNIAFSHFGFKKLGIDDGKLSDSAFLAGQRADAEGLHDKGTGTGPSYVPDWEQPFKKEIHGVFLLAGDSHATIDKKLHDIKNIFGVGGPKPSIKEITTVRGDTRPGDQSAHEHFGYLDGVSNPAIKGFAPDANPPPGPAPIDAGVIVTGYPGDEKQRDRESWQLDGSFLVFRYLFQKVPEFNKFVFDNRLRGPGLTDKEGADLLGARLIGRWKSGAPLDITPFIDDPKLGVDPQENNNFHFAAESQIQKLCPFAAHVRKTLPRADLEELPVSIAKFRIMRRGIQFGPEVTEEEKKAKKTSQGRGLVFVCYQSSIENGFQFMQKRWVNNAKFPPRAPEDQRPGVDPILGQGPDRDRITGYNPNKPTDPLELTGEWIIPRGGEYFFSPSLKALKERIAHS